MSSSNHRDWDERRSPQWKYLLQQKDPKYHRRKQKEYHLRMEREKKLELERLTDCTPSEEQSGTDLAKAYTNVINTELAAGLNKIKKEGK